MRILVITNLYPPQVLGGYEILCAQVVDELRRRGHEVEVSTSRSGAETLPVPDAPGIHRELELEMPFDRPFRSSRRRRVAVGRGNEGIIARRIERERPDLIFMWSLRRLTLGPARAAEASGIPVAWTLNDEYLAGFKPVAGALSMRRLLGVIIDHSWARQETLEALRLQHMTVISRTLRQSLVEQGVPVEKAEVIYQGPPTERFPRRPQAIRRIRRCLYVGQLHPDKGVHTAIEAMHLLAQDDNPGEPNVALTIVGHGEGDYPAYLRDLAEAGPAPIHFTGARPHGELPEIYRRHDLLLFPSIWTEPFGLTHLEAMSSGLAVISTGHGGQGEALEDGRHALLAAPGDAKAWAAAIRRLVEDPGLARALADGGHSLVHGHFNLEAYVGRLESWLENIRDEEAIDDRLPGQAA